MLNIKKIAIILFMTVLLLLMFSCAKDNAGEINKKTDPANSVGSLDSDGHLPDTTGKWHQEPNNLPETDFGGRDFSVLLPENDENRPYLYFAVEEQTGDDIIDALYKRNLTVEEKYNIKINEIGKPNVADTARKSILAGDNQYDLIIDYSIYMNSLATQSHLADLYEVPYIRDGLDKSWWDQSFRRDLSINKKLHYGAGHLILRDKLRISCIFFNKGMCQTFDIEYPYKYVYDGTWTLDKFIEMSKGINADLNGDGVMDQNDRWGIMADTSFATYIFEAAGEKMMRLDKDGIPEITMNQPRAVDVIQKALIFCTTPESMFFADDIKGASNIWYRANELFAEDRFLLRMGIIEHVVRDLRPMETDFGLVPMFKFDENQEDYYSRADSWGYVVSIPKNADFEFAGIITEALAYESGSTLIPAFYDICLTSKHLRDNESEGMLDIIFNNTTYDIGYIYNIGNQQEMLNNLIKKKSTDFASAFEKAQSSMEMALQKFIDSYSKN